MTPTLNSDRPNYLPRNNYVCMYLGHTDLMLNELSSSFNSHTLQMLRGLCLLKCPSKTLQNMANFRFLFKHKTIFSEQCSQSTSKTLKTMWSGEPFSFKLTSPFCEFNLSLSLSLSIKSHYVFLWMQPATFDICLPVKRPMHKGLQNFD